MECTSATMPCPHSNIKFSTFDHNQENQSMLRTPAANSVLPLNIFRKLQKFQIMKHFFKIASIWLVYHSLQRHEPSGIPNTQNCSQKRLSELSHREARTRFAYKTSRTLQHHFFFSGKIQAHRLLLFLEKIRTTHKTTVIFCCAETLWNRVNMFNVVKPPYRNILIWF